MILKKKKKHKKHRYSHIAIAIAMDTFRWWWSLVAVVGKKGEWARTLDPWGKEKRCVRPKQAWIWLMGSEKKL